MNQHLMVVREQIINEGDWVSIDGSTGEVFLGQLETMVPDISDAWLMKLLGWADDYSGAWACGLTPTILGDAKRARDYGAGGIGLCRTEHMFFQSERLPIVQQHDHDQAARRAPRGVGCAAAVPAGGFHRPLSRPWRGCR